MSGSFAAFLVLAVVGGAVAILLAWRAEQKRREEMMVWARANGFRYHQGRNRDLLGRLAAFSEFQQGHSRHARHVCDGEREGRRVTAFDYHYATTTHTGKSSSTQHHDFSAVLIETGLPLKPLTIRPETLFDRFALMVGFDDIDFESTAFSDRFHVSSPDRRWAHDVLHQATMEFLLEAPDFTIEMAGPWILARRTTRFTPKDFSAAVAVLEGIVGRLPRYLRGEWKGVEA